MKNANRWNGPKIQPISEGQATQPDNQMLASQKEAEEMRNIAALLYSFGLILMVGCAPAQKPTEAAKTVRIGTYDSRAIAVAFIGSEVYKETAGKEMAVKMAEYKDAEAKGDTKRVEELKAWGESQQALLHKQGFSTASVDDILQHISDQLPEIMQAANVDLLVSRWDEKTLSEHESAERVDVTMRLIEAFTPNEKQKKSAIEIQKNDPVPLEKMTAH